MTTTLSEGVKVPDVGSTNWAGDLEVNWNLLNGALANLSGNVKLDRDNTWTGEQSFTLPIVGSITGTASKAIADEDGTSIKTGYVNVAGNQTVTGQKTFSANIHFTSGLYQRNTTYEIGTTPASNINITQFLADKDSKYTGCLRNAISTTGLTSVELEARNKIGSGALSPTGNATSSTFKVEVQPDGSKSLYFDGSIRNNVLPYTTNTYSLGSSSYQWSSVYAQSYFYNGTAWGLDKANVWSENNRFVKNVGLSDVSTYSDNTMAFTANANTIFFNTRGSSNYPSYGTFLFAGYASGTTPDRYGQLKLVRSTDIKGGTYDGYKPDTSFNLWRVAPHYSLMDFVDAVRVQNDGTNNYIAPITTNTTDLGTSTNQWSSVYAQTYYYNGTQWGLDKANVWTQSQTFKNSDVTIGTTTGTGYIAFNYTDSNNSTLAYHRTSKFSNGNTCLSWKVYNTDSNSQSINSELQFYITKAGGKVFTPVENGEIDLGTSTNKWKTLNGVNPGALSLPDNSKSVTIDTTNWDVAGGTNVYTPPANGWLHIRVMGATELTVRWDDWRFGDRRVSATATDLGVTIPVVAGVTVSVVTVASGFNGKCQFFPCLGNV